MLCLLTDTLGYFPSEGFLLPEFPGITLDLSLLTRTQQIAQEKLHLKGETFLSVLHLEILKGTFCDNEQNLVVPGDTSKALLIQTKRLLSNGGSWPGWWQPLEA